MGRSMPTMLPHSCFPAPTAESVDEVLAGPHVQHIRLAGLQLLRAFRPIAGDPAQRQVEVEEAVAAAQTCLDEGLGLVHAATDAAMHLAQAVSGMHSFRIGQVDWLVLACTDSSAGPGMAIAHQPVLGEWFFSQSGVSWCVAERSRRRLRTASVHQLERASLCIGDGINHAIGAEREAVDALSTQMQFLRHVGTAYALCLLAMGVVDVVVDTDVSSKEMSVLGPIVRAAGGVVADWGGDPAHSGRILAAANEPLFRRALDSLAWGPSAGGLRPASLLQ